MGDCEDGYRFLCETLALLPPGEKVRIPKSCFPTAPFPTWRRSVGYHVWGASFRQYRDGCVHVHETTTEWIFHRDRVSPHDSIVQHLREDCPGTFWVSTAFLSLTLIGALAGAARRFVPAILPR